MAGGVLPARRHPRRFVRRVALRGRPGPRRHGPGPTPTTSTLRSSPRRPSSRRTSRRPSWRSATAWPARMCPRCFACRPSSVAARPTRCWRRITCLARRRRWPARGSDEIWLVCSRAAHCPPRQWPSSTDRRCVRIPKRSRRVFGSRRSWATWPGGWAVPTSTSGCEAKTRHYSAPPPCRWSSCSRRPRRASCCSTRRSST